MAIQVEVAGKHTRRQTGVTTGRGDRKLIQVDRPSRTTDRGGR